MPTRCHEYRKRWHCFEQISPRPLRRNAEDNKNRKDPNPKESLFGDEFASMLPTFDADTKERECKQTSIDKPTSCKCPHTVSAPEKSLKPSSDTTSHLANIFAHHEVAPDQLRFWIENKPKRKHSKGNNRCPKKSRQGSSQEDPPLPLMQVQMPPCKSKSNWEQLCETFCQQSHSRKHADDRWKKKARVE